jgi:hypothetical protein
MPNVEHTMSEDILLGGPDHDSRRHPLDARAERGRGARRGHGLRGVPGIIVERDVLESIAARRDPEQQSVSDSATADAVTATVDSRVEQDVKERAEGAFRPLLAVYGAPPGPGLPLEGVAQNGCLGSNHARIGTQ